MTGPISPDSSNGVSFVNGFHVAMVCARLSSGQESITEAAFQSGYNSLANFNRRFREITGFTPSEFRLQTRRMQQDSGKPFVMRLDGNGAVRITPPTGTAGMIGWGRSLNGRAAKREHRPAAKRA